MIPSEVLLQGYRLGVFPMAMDDGEIEWFSPNVRGVISLDKFHVPHALQRVLRKGVFEIRVNTAFARVMRHCAARPRHMEFIERNNTSRRWAKTTRSRRRP